MPQHCCLHTAAVAVVAPEHEFIITYCDHAGGGGYRSAMDCYADHQISWLRCRAPTGRTKSTKSPSNSHEAAMLTRVYAHDLWRRILGSIVRG